jgi:hypothetical protein
MATTGTILFLAKFQNTMTDQDYFVAPFHRPLIHEEQLVYIIQLGYYGPYYKNNAKNKCKSNTLN